MNDYEVRSLDIGDLEALTALEKECFSDPWTEVMLADSLENPSVHTVGAFDGDILIGYLMWMSLPPDCEILNVACKPSYRRQGIARALFGYCRRENGKNVSHYMLEVRDSNAPARALYARLGFMPVEVRRNYYKNPKEDAILMDLYL